MRFGWTRVAVTLLLLSAQGAMAEASNFMHHATLLGTWNCATARDHAEMLVTFRLDGTVVGHSKDKSLAGRYVQEGDSLSIVGSDQVIAPSSLQIVPRSASASLLNGDQINCRRIK